MARPTMPAPTTATRCGVWWVAGCPATVVGIGTSLKDIGYARVSVQHAGGDDGMPLYAGDNHAALDRCVADNERWSPVVAVSDVVAALGGGLLRTLVAAPGVAVTDVVIAEPSDRVADLRGDLVVGAGVADGASAVELVERAAAAGAAGVVLRRAPARARGVRAAAKRVGVALLELDESASLVHAVRVIQDVVDRAAAPDAAPVDPGGETDLLALADAAAALVDGPVTIEDAQSRVLAYSTRQDVTDTARVSTVLGRRVPAPLVAHLRSRGVFRRLATSDEPFLVPPGPGQEMPRYVVPVRAGGEWLGSIWAVIDRPPPADAVAELRRTASVVALHLLRNRAFADLTRRLSAERLRALLGGGPVEPTASDWLPRGPWRAVALGPTGPATGAGGVEADLDVWESRFRRRGWRQPLLTDLGDLPYAVVVADSEPGTTTGPGDLAVAGRAGRRVGLGRRRGHRDVGGSRRHLCPHRRAGRRPAPGATPTSDRPPPPRTSGRRSRWPGRSVRSPVRAPRRSAWPVRSRSWPITTVGGTPHTSPRWQRGWTTPASPRPPRKALGCT